MKVTGPLMPRDIASRGVGRFLICTLVRVHQVCALS